MPLDDAVDVDDPLTLGATLTLLVLVCVPEGVDDLVPEGVDVLVPVTDELPV